MLFINKHFTHIKELKFIEFVELCFIQSFMHFSGIYIYIYIYEEREREREREGERERERYDPLFLIEFCLAHRKAKMLLKLNIILRFYFMAIDFLLLTKVLFILHCYHAEISWTLVLKKSLNTDEVQLRLLARLISFSMVGAPNDTFVCCMNS